MTPLSDDQGHDATVVETPLPLVTVVVPSWNGATILPPCLDSIRRQTYRPLQVIVVDDGSTDDTAAMVTSAFPEVQVARLPCNTGFACAVNTGLRLAEGEIVVLLNNDAVAERGWVAELIGALQRHPTAGFAASKMLLSDDDGTINSVGDFVRRTGEPGNRGVWERDEGQYEREEEVFGACAGAAAYRRSMLDDIGLFDERFYMYCEDVDLAWRAQYAGYRCVYAPRAIVRHQLSATGGGVLSSYQVGRNLVWLLARDLPAQAWRIYWPWILRGQLRQVRDSLPHLREPAARARLRGQLAGLVTFAIMLRGRSALGTSRRVSQSYLVGLLT